MIVRVQRWRGKNPIQRNAVIALGNFKEKAAVPKLIEIMTKEPRAFMRGTAAWSLSRIGGQEALEAVEQALEVEQDELVIGRLQLAKQRLEMQGVNDQQE